MSYVDGYVAAVPAANKNAFIAHSSAAAASFMRHGALSYNECWGDDVPDGEVTSFPMAVKATADEVVIFSWVEWPSKRHRDEAMPKIMAEMETVMDDLPMPFDGQRIIFGGFEKIVHFAAQQ